jgi:hypothetical protein
LRLNRLQKYSSTKKVIWQSIVQVGWLVPRDSFNLGLVLFAAVQFKANVQYLEHVSHPSMSNVKVRPRLSWLHPHLCGWLVLVESIDASQGGRFLVLPPFHKRSARKNSFSHLNVRSPLAQSPVCVQFVFSWLEYAPPSPPWRQLWHLSKQQILVLISASYEASYPNNQRFAPYWFPCTVLRGGRRGGWGGSTSAKYGIRAPPALLVNHSLQLHPAT